MRRPRYIGVIVLVLLFLAALPQQGMAQASPPAAGASRPGDALTLQVQPHFAGTYKYGEWLPLRVSVGNSGGDLDAELRALITSGGASTAYVAPAPLPAGAQKDIELYVLLPSFARNVTVDLLADDQVLKSATIDVRAMRNVTYVVGVVASDASAYSLMESMELATAHRTVSTASFPLRDLPDRPQALRTFDALVLGDVDTQPLAPAQAEALRQWVAAGGRLIVAGGPGAERTLAGLPPELAPASVERDTARDLVALAGFAGTGTGGIEGEFSAAYPDAAFGHVLAGAPDRPLVAERRVGQGWVTYLAFDPALSPFSAWAGMRAVWATLLAPGAVYPSNLPPDVSPAQMAAQRLVYVLTNLPSLELPSIRWLAILLGVYILLVGPVNYLVLRRLRRLERAWVSIPVLTFVFAGCAFGVGYGLRGNDVILNQVSTIQRTAAGSPALIRTYVGVFSPARSTYSLQVQDGALVAPLVSEPDRFGGPFEATGMTILNGEPALVRDLGINQWAMQSFQAERYAPSGEWDLKADLRYQDDRVEGVVRNPTPYDLSDVVIVAGSRFARLGDIPAGGEIKVDTALQGAANGASPFPYALFEEQMRTAGVGGVSREITLKQNLLEGFFNQDPGISNVSVGLTVFGWLKASPIHVSLLRGEAGHQETSLLLVTTPLDLGGTEVTLPPGLLQPRLVDSQSEAGQCGPGGRLFVGNGDATAEYLVPAGLLDATVTRLTFTVGSDSDPAPALPEASLYDWPARSWVALPSLAIGANVVDEPARFVNASDGAVRLKLHAENGQGKGSGCFLYDLGLDAAAQQAGMTGTGDDDE